MRVDRQTIEHFLAVLDQPPGDEDFDRLMRALNRCKSYSRNSRALGTCPDTDGRGLLRATWIRRVTDQAAHTRVVIEVGLAPEQRIYRLVSPVLVLLNRDPLCAPGSGSDTP